MKLDLPLLPPNAVLLKSEVFQAIVAPELFDPLLTGFRVLLILQDGTGVCHQPRETLAMRSFKDLAGFCSEVVGYDWLVVNATLGDCG